MAIIQRKTCSNNVYVYVKNMNRKTINEEEKGMEEEKRNYWNNMYNY